MIITGPIEFHIALSNVEVTLKQRWYNFLSMLSNVMSMSGIDVVQSSKLYVRFCFIFNVGPERTIDGSNALISNYIH